MDDTDAAAIEDLLQSELIYGVYPGPPPQPSAVGVSCRVCKSSKAYTHAASQHTARIARRPVSMSPRLVLPLTTTTTTTTLAHFCPPCPPVSTTTTPPGSMRSYRTSTARDEFQVWNSGRKEAAVTATLVTPHRNDDNRDTKMHLSKRLVLMTCKTVPLIMFWYE